MSEKLLINQDKSNNSEVKSNNLPFTLTNEEKVIVKEIIADICPFYKEYGTCEQCNTALDIEDEPCYWECMAKTIVRNRYRKQSDNVIELPCKVGDITYIFDYKVNNHLETKFRGITPSVVEAITIVDDGLWIENEHAKYHISSVGDLIFFTKEEAEQALAKMKGGEE